MPSVIATRATLTISGGEARFQPNRFTGDPARLIITVGNVSAGPQTSGGTVVTAPDLDRLQRLVKYFNPDGTATPKMVLDWQNTMEAIEAALAGLTGQVTDLTAIVNRLAAAEALAAAANDTANASANNISITNSYTDPVSVLTASSDGVITIAAHTRIYGDGVSVAVNGGSVSGFAQGAYVSVFYDDAARQGGAVSYQGTTDLVAQSGSTHSVGQISIPYAGSPPSSGGGVSPPGYVPRAPDGGAIP